MDPLLQVKNLRIQFNTLEGLVHAVNGVSFDLDQGKTLGIVGESGCGKSVTVLSLMRLIPEPPGKIVSGEVLFKGEDLLKKSQFAIEKIRGEEIAMVFQDPMTSLNPVLTIGSQISESLRVHHEISKEDAIRRTWELLDMVGIPRPKERYNSYPHEFSGGMRQRVMIAMALSCNPSILIADEPTTALDVTIQAQIVDLAKKIQEHLGMAIIWITHDLGIVAEIADRVIVMYAGQVVEEGNVYQIFDNPKHPYTASLLKSLPRVDSHQYERLATIQGSPPDCIHLPSGCPFLPRCEFGMEKCEQENPELLIIEEDHKVACWVDMVSRSLR